MDGREGRLKDSIRLRLSLWLALAIAAASIAAGAISYGGAFDEANELQDDVLRQVSALVRAQPALAARGARTLASAAADADPESRLVVQFVPGPAGTGALVLP
ncbi:MAG: two-component sensor histidine kinase, partial [Burkholderiales bacterium]|nr:two-component sensor histidine kinase [Burkholderiales bacterium]